MKKFPLYFNSSKPSAYDWLGDIQWELPYAVCPEHGMLKADEVQFGSQYYDGYNWSYPMCHCGRSITCCAYPVNTREREIWFSKRPEAQENYDAWMAHLSAGNY
jgi:hypothetical protein